MLRGLPTADIARRLFISRHTLGDHIKAIFAKLALSSRPELTALLLDRAVPRASRRSRGGARSWVTADSLNLVPAEADG